MANDVIYIVPRPVYFGDINLLFSAQLNLSSSCYHHIMFAILDSIFIVVYETSLREHIYLVSVILKYWRTIDIWIQCHDILARISGLVCLLAGNNDVMAGRLLGVLAVQNTLLEDASRMQTCCKHEIVGPDLE